MVGVMGGSAASAATSGHDTALASLGLCALMTALSLLIAPPLSAQLYRPPAGYQPLPTTVPRTHQLGAPVSVRVRARALSAALAML